MRDLKALSMIPTLLVVRKRIPYVVTLREHFLIQYH